MGIKYQLNVAAILQKPGGEILIGERFDIAGAWQFPQGGVDKGESLEEALRRELIEEISLQPHFYEVIEHRGPYRYLYGGGKTKKGFEGKDQHYFLARFMGPDCALDIQTAHPEFRALRWLRPEGFEIGWLPEMKREVYRAVWSDFFGLEL